MSRKFIATIMISALTLTGFSAAQAQASDRDLARFLTGAAALVIIGAALNDRNDHRKPQVATHGRAPVMQRHQPRYRPHPPVVHHHKSVVRHHYVRPAPRVHHHTTKHHVTHHDVRKPTRHTMQKVVRRVERTRTVTTVQPRPLPKRVLRNDWYER